MKKTHKIFPILFLFASLPTFAQLKYDLNHPIELLEKTYYQAEVEKDSANLGMAALLLYKKRRKRDGSKFKDFDLVTLAVKCFEAVGDDFNYHRARFNLQQIYNRTKQYEAALKLGEKNYQYFRSVDHKHLQVHTLYSLGRIHNSLGNEAISADYFQKSLAINRIVKDTLIDVLTFMGLIPSMLKSEKLDSGLLAAQRMYQLSKAIHQEDRATIALFYSGQLLRKKGTLDSAIFYFNSVIDYYENDDFAGHKKLAFRELYKCYQEKGDFKNAFRYANLHAYILDNIHKKRQEDALEKLTIEYESKEKEKAIQELEQEKIEAAQRARQKNYLLGGLSLSLAIVLGLLAMLYRFSKERRRKDKIILEQSQNLQQQQIKSLKNSLELTATQSMLDGQEEERARIARDLHDSLGGLLSTVKLNIQNSPEKAKDLLDEATQEIRMIAQNLQPLAFQKMGLVKAVRDLIYLHQQEDSQKIKSPKITFQHYHVPENLSEKIALHFYRIIQESLHNALKHAEANEILIQINGEPKGLSIMIEDNGKGFDSTQKYKGDGLLNFQKRAEFLNADLTIESGETGTGVYLFWEKDKI